MKVNNHVIVIGYKTSLDQRQLARRVAKADHNRVPVTVVYGWMRPKQVGYGGYWETPAGNICHYPHAYQKACGNPVYIASTRQIIVGQHWIETHS